MDSIMTTEEPPESWMMMVATTGGTNEKKAGRVLKGRTWDEMPRSAQRESLVTLRARALAATG
jgi:protein gp37